MALLFLLCSCCPPRHLVEVNNAVNAHPYIEGQWQCIDYVNAKADLLMAEGMSPEKLAVVYGTVYGEQHVVLRVRDGMQLWYLDNVNKEVDQEPSVTIIQTFEEGEWRKLKLTTAGTRRR